MVYWPEKTPMMRLFTFQFLFGIARFPRPEVIAGRRRTKDASSSGKGREAMSPQLRKSAASAVMRDSALLGVRRYLAANTRGSERVLYTYPGYV